MRHDAYAYIVNGTLCKKLNVQKLFPSLTLKLQFDVSVKHVTETE